MTAIAYYLLVWLAPALALTWLVLTLVDVGYAGTVLRCATILRAIGRFVERGWSSVIRALEQHAHESHERHTRRFSQEVAE